MIYKCLHTQSFSNGNFAIVPIRYEDRQEIMQWRNEQIYHLRQAKPLTLEDQENYFNNVVNKLFDQEKPNQILFSYLENGVCIGYGGLVHINWIDQNAEISFIINTALEKDSFKKHWTTFLGLIEKIAFVELKLHKLFTFAFDLRPHLYEVLENANYNKEAVLKEHCFFENKFLDVLIHSKTATNIVFRKASKNDLELYFEWSNDTEVRENSYNKEKINLTEHTKWFLEKLEDKNCEMYLFENNQGKPIGQVRIQIENEQNAVIGVSVDKAFRGKGYSHKMIALSSNDFLSKNPSYTIFAYIKEQNTASKITFEKAGYDFYDKIIYKDVASLKYIYKK